MANHTPTYTAAGSGNKSGKKSTGTMTTICARGKKTIYVAMTPEIAPEAPIAGRIESELIRICVALAATPLTRYRNTNRAPPSRSSTARPKIHRNHMLKRMCASPPWRNRLTKIAMLPIRRSGKPSGCVSRAGTTPNTRNSRSSWSAGNRAQNRYTPTLVRISDVVTAGSWRFGISSAMEITLAGSPSSL